MEICVHCDETASPAIFREDDPGHTEPFCCVGCLTVFEILKEKGLSSYYDIKKSSAIYRRRSPVETRDESYLYMDGAEFLTEYSYADSSGDRVMEFYLEGIHCLACLWLVEKLPEIVDGVLSSKLDLERSVVTITLGQGGSFATVASELDKLGYRPHPLKKSQDVADLKAREDRKALIRIGVAGAAAGNIMIYSVSLYGGAAGDYARLFNALTVAFAVPVLTYSAFPFYQNAWSALKNKTLSIDIPISISLIMGAVMGFYNLLNDVPDNYFDSLTALVFLLSLSRYFLQKIQDRGLSATDLNYFYQNESVHLADGRTIHPRFIKEGDVLRIGPKAFIPADGIVIDGHSHINQSLLTGESMPVPVTVGAVVYSGTQNLEGEIQIGVSATPDESRLGKLLQRVENGRNFRSKIVALTNKVSKVFTFTVIVLSVILFFVLLSQHGFHRALEGALTLLIVTCPCALALAVPLTFTRAIARAAQNGIIIKSDEAIEKAAGVKDLFIDKTGTITYGKLTVTDLTVLKSGLLPVEDVIVSLEASSRHPVALALLTFASGRGGKGRPVSEIKEIIGKGVQGTISGHRYAINRDGIFEDDVLLATYAVRDGIRPDSRGALSQIRDLGVNVTVLSGDRSGVVQAIAAEAGLPASAAKASLTPEEKSELLSGATRSMMVGDGANDAIALSRAQVGVAVLGAMDISLRAADVYLTTPGLVPVEKLLILSRETMRVIRRNLVLSLCYNSLSVVLAFAGVINPLIAAIIMPVSSLTVVLSTLFGTKKLRTLWK